MKIFSRKKVVVLIVFCCFTVVLSHAQEGEVTITQDERIEQLMEIKKTMNKNDDGEKRYRIQIYNGTLSGARNVIAGFKTGFSDWPCDILFETPNYKVLVGKYRTRLEADRYLVKIKERYPNAFIPKPR